MNAPTAKKGRPFLYSTGKMRPTSVTMDDATKAKALAIGGGKLSKGVRIAVEAFSLAQVPAPAALASPAASPADIAPPQSSPDV